MEMLDRARMGNPSAIRELREMSLKLWTDVEVQGVNAFMKHRDHVHLLVKQRASGSIYLKRHFKNDKPELADVLWVAHLERNFYLSCCAFPDGSFVYWILTDYDKPLCDVTHWMHDYLREKEDVKWRHATNV